MSKHLFRLLFGAFFLVAATAFTGCSDDDDKSLTPKLTADPTALNFTDTRGKKRKQVIDAVAAVIILEDYLAYRKNRA